MIKDISVIIPVYNEEACIGEVVDQVEALLGELDLNGYEIIAVNDGSTDRTGEILKEKSVMLLEHMINQGYGASIKHGISRAKYEHILIMDADGTYPKDSIPMLLNEADNYDMVVGARIGKQVAIPFFRRFPKWLLKKMADYLVGSKIPDLNSGLRIFKKSVAADFIGIFPSGFSFTTTITLAFLSNNYQVHYIPINYFKREGKSKFRPFQDTLNLITLILRTSLYFQPLKIFVPLSLILFCLAIAVFVYSKFFTPQVMDITVIVILMASVQILAIGLIADLVDKRIKR